MTIHFKCQSCGQAVRAEDSAAGRRAKCPTCGEINQIPDAPLADAEEIYDAEELPFADADGMLDATEDVSIVGRKPCPMCGEMIVENAAKCRYCGEIFDTELKKHAKKDTDVDADMTGGDWVLAILCSGIGCILGVVWMIQGKKKGLKMVGVSFGMSVLWSLLRVALESSVGP